ncbi:MAG: Bug family tripartite tricarboxylate transporter substrate binding protein [Burkholderiales bacterium]
MKSGFKLSIAGLIAAFSLPCMAQSYPVKPVRVLIVFPPGGSNDVTARIVFSKMAAITGQQFVLENRGGAAGTIGAEVVAKSPPDGYTVMVQSTTHIANARSKQFPDLPAIAEFVRGYEFVGWVGCFVPAGTPRPVVDTLNAALKKALEDPEISSKLFAQTLDPLYAMPEQFAVMITFSRISPNLRLVPTARGAV